MATKISLVNVNKSVENADLFTFTTVTENFVFCGVLAQKTFQGHFNVIFRLIQSCDVRQCQIVYVHVGIYNVEQHRIIAA